MKLLLYSHSFAPNVGGVETIALSLARGLADLRTPDDRPEFDVTVATATPAGNFEDGSLPFRIVRGAGLLKLWSLISASDVIHLAGPALLPLFLAWLARKPVVLEHHGYQAICPNGLLLHQPDRVICPGHFQAARYGKCVRCEATEMSWSRSLKKLLLTFPRHALVNAAACNIAVSRHVSERLALPRIRVVYHGIENTSGEDVSATGNPSISEKMRFAYVGRLVPEKGVAVLLEAAEILKREKYEFELSLIGDGPQRPQLEAIIKRGQLRDSVRITGFLQGVALTEALCGTHVVVMPSVWEETAGLAAIEQMMRGRLVIASKIGGLGEMIGDAGLMCLPGNAEDLARCMREVLQDPAIVARLGSKGRERARPLFLRERMIDDHVRIYRDVSGRDA